MGELFGTPKLPPPGPPPAAPGLADEAVQAQTDALMAQQSNAQGRASTVLTNPAVQDKPDSDMRRYLGMA